MENRKDKLTAIVCCCIAAALVIGLAAAYIGGAKAKLDMQNKTAATDHEAAYTFDDETVFFATLEEYEAYLLKEAVDAGKYDSIEKAEAVYYAPETIPEGIELVGITVSSFGPVFEYTKAGGMRDIAFDADDDETLAEVFTTTRVQLYSPSYQYEGFVSDFREYGENLAASLNAPLSTSEPNDDTYIGSVYCDVTQNGIMQNVMVGYQVVHWHESYDQQNVSTEYLTYNYFPIGLTQSEMDCLQNIVPHAVYGSN